MVISKRILALSFVFVCATISISAMRVMLFPEPSPDILKSALDDFFDSCEDQNTIQGKPVVLNFNHLTVCCQPHQRYDAQSNYFNAVALFVGNDEAIPFEIDAIMKYCKQLGNCTPAVPAMGHYTPAAAKCQSVNTPSYDGSAGLFFDQLSIFSQVYKVGLKRLCLFDKDKNRLCINPNNEIFIGNPDTDRKVFLMFDKNGSSVVLFCGNCPATQIEQAAITTFFRDHDFAVAINELFYKQLLIMNGKISWQYKQINNEILLNNFNCYRSIIDQISMTPRVLSNPSSDDVEVINQERSKPEGFEKLEELKF